MDPGSSPPAELEGLSRSGPAAFDFLHEAFEKRQFLKLRRLLATTAAPDIAEVLGQMGIDDVIVGFRLVARPRKPEVFTYLRIDQQADLIDHLPDRTVTSILNNMEPDDRTRLLESLSEDLRTRILTKLLPEERRLARQLLSYPEDSVGRIMHPEFFSVRPSMTAREAIAHLRWRMTGHAQDVSSVFVTDPSGRYLGEIGLSALVFAEPPTQRVEDMSAVRHPTLLTTDNPSTAVDYFRKYDRSLLAVCDEANTMVGVLAADDVFDVAEEHATEEIQQFGGQATLEDSYFETPLLVLLWKRVGWLCMLFIGGTVTAGTLRHYNNQLKAMEYLIYFLPLVISSGGNSGSQSASLSIRGIAVKEMASGDWVKVLRREVVTGIGLGTVLGALGVGLCWLWDLPSAAWGIVMVALIGVVVFGAVVGSMLPFLLKALRLDPAVSSSPFIASLVDLFGVMLLVQVSRWVLGI